MSRSTDLPTGPEPDRIWRFRVWMDAEGIGVVVARQSDGVLILSAASSVVATDGDVAVALAPMLKAGVAVAILDLATTERAAVEESVARAGALFRVY